MRIIAGALRGRRIEMPKAANVRPTLDRVRESLFNILGDAVEDARFLDLYAGSGANGIEALSRGARAAAFVDSSSQALRVLKRNIASLDLAGQAQILRLNLPERMASLVGFAPFEIAFADPPYAALDARQLLSSMTSHRIMANGGTFVLEHDAGQEAPQSEGDFERVRQKKYGQTFLSFYEINVRQRSSQDSAEPIP
jgi:16S rRNA (guanine(966)-N(2))-methyltransferase RsmD